MLKKQKKFTYRDIGTEEVGKKRVFFIYIMKRRSKKRVFFAYTTSNVHLML